MIGKDRCEFHFPTSITFGAGVSNEVAEHIASKGLKKPLIVTDPGFYSLDIYQEFIKQFTNVGEFSGIDKNPIKANVLAGVKVFKDELCDAIIGIGGGASMDVARAIALGAYHDRDLFDYDDAKGGDRYVTNRIPYFITIPTTSGTGSEVGRSTVISDDETHEKKILFSPRLLAAKVFADPLLTMNLPAHITAATGMDALSHNIEAYLSKGYSPLCDALAVEGIKMIFKNLPGAVNSPNLENRSQMMMAALMGATAFQKGLGIVHSLAHPLSTVFDMHHGLANAIMLRYGVEFNENVCSDKLTSLCQVLNINNPSSKSFRDALDKLNQKINMPTSLKKEIDINDSRLEKLATLAFNDVCHSCNPKVVTKVDFLNIYTKACQ